MPVQPGSQNDKIVKALRCNKRGLTSRQIIEVSGSTAPATRMSELKAMGFKIIHRHFEGDKYPVYMLVE